jgi:hypothetical protein
MVLVVTLPYIFQVRRPLPGVFVGSTYHLAHVLACLITYAEQMKGSWRNKHDSSLGYSTRKGVREQL